MCVCGSASYYTYIIQFNQLIHTIKMTNFLSLQKLLILLCLQTKCMDVKIRNNIVK